MHYFECSIVAVVDGGGVINLNPPNSSSGRYNDIAAIITITVDGVVANSVVIINPHNTNSGRFIAIAAVVVHVHNVYVAVLVGVAVVIVIGTLLRILLWLLLFLPLSIYLIHNK